MHMMTCQVLVLGQNTRGVTITHVELKGLKQKGGESLRDYYQRFGELRAQVHDITEQEVIEAFSNGIMARWQF